MKDDYKSLMTFEDQGEAFALGFECGLIWQKMDRMESFNKYIFHAKNQKEIKKMCKRFLYQFSIEHIDDEWRTLTAQINLLLIN